MKHSWVHLSRLDSLWPRLIPALFIARSPSPAPAPSNSHGGESAEGAATTRAASARLILRSLDGRLFPPTCQKCPPSLLDGIGCRKAPAARERPERARVGVPHGCTARGTVSVREGDRAVRGEPTSKQGGEAGGTSSGVPPEGLTRRASPREGPLGHWASYRPVAGR